jgi:hypothetical protein
VNSGQGGGERAGVAVAESTIRSSLFGTAARTAGCIEIGRTLKHKTNSNNNLLEDAQKKEE